MQLGQGMHDYDEALVAFLNGDDGGPALLRRLAATIAEGRMLDAGQLAELNELLARTPVTAQLVDGGEGRARRLVCVAAAPRPGSAQALRGVQPLLPRFDAEPDAALVYAAMRRPCARPRAPCTPFAMI